MYGENVLVSTCQWLGVTLGGGWRANGASEWQKAVPVGLVAQPGIGLCATKHGTLSFWTSAALSAENGLMGERNLSFLQRIHGKLSVSHLSHGFQRT